MAVSAMGFFQIYKFYIRANSGWQPSRRKSKMYFFYVCRLSWVSKLRLQLPQIPVTESCILPLLTDSIRDTEDFEVTSWCFTCKGLLTWSLVFWRSRLGRRPARNPIGPTAWADGRRAWAEAWGPEPALSPSSPRACPLAISNAL